RADAAQRGPEAADAAGAVDTVESGDPLADRPETPRTVTGVELVAELPERRAARHLRPGDSRVRRLRDCKRRQDERESQCGRERPHAGRHAWCATATIPLSRMPPMKSTFASTAAVTKK